MRSDSPVLPSEIGVRLQNLEQIIADESSRERDTRTPADRHGCGRALVGAHILHDLQVGVIKVLAGLLLTAVSLS